MRSVHAFAALAVVAGGLGLAGTAHAAPGLGAVPLVVDDGAITHVADGCGPGRRYSYRRGFCVSFGPRFYGPPVVYGGGPRFYGGGPRYGRGYGYGRPRPYGYGGPRFGRPF